MTPEQSEELERFEADCEAELERVTAWVLASAGPMGSRTATFSSAVIRAVFYHMLSQGYRKVVEPA